ncbi:MAG: mycofactocin system transcriptional regulator [Solirubrobacterales bacterium]|nr:mycofactocin system transcriptional regulator [Solirubrobacterales bacterium]
MTPPDPPDAATVRGRPPSTTHDEVERVALELFARDGFETTTMDDIATALGLGRRTLFRYFPSKNDIVWGNFDQVLDRLRGLLAATPDEVPLRRALAEAIVESNHYEPDQLHELRIRMTLITSTPALQAHSMLRYAAWRRVIADFVAGRRGEQADDLVPLTMGHVCLGTSMAAFSKWVASPGDDLDANLVRAFRTLAGVDDEA